MLRPFAVALAVAAGGAGPLTAVAAEAPVQALLKQYNCIHCHAPDRKLVGPSYRDVAQKYKGQPNASAVLAKRVREGSKGVWGPVPMPPNAGPKDAEITAMVAYVLAP